ncbi:MAG: hypothetical protein ACP5SI_00965, partial [Chloroflexia bacterium]
MVRRARIPFSFGREALWTGSLFLLFLFAVLVQPIRSADFWWHLKVGEIVLEEHAVPRVDRFSTIVLGQPFTYQSWLAGLLFALLFRLGGPGADVVAHAFLLTAAYVLLWLACRKAGKDSLVATACTFVAMVVCGGNWGVRPQSFSTFLFALYFYLLVRLGLGERVRWWVFPLCMVFWANLHGAFILGLGLLAGALLGEAVARFLPGRPFGAMPGGRLAELVGGFGASVAATLLNPAGAGIYAYVRTVQQHPVTHRTIAEWQPPRVDSAVGGVFYTSLFAVFLVLVYVGHRPHPRGVLWLLGTAVLALWGVRSILWYTFPMALLFAEAAGKVWQPRPLAPRTGQAIVNALILGLLALLVICALPPFKGYLPLPEELRSTLAPDTPVRAAQYLLDHRFDGPIFHRMEHGDYLLWRLYPQYRVFVDPRLELYSPSFWEIYDRISRGGAEAGTLLDRYGVQVLLLDIGRQAGLYDWARRSSSWHICFLDESEGTAVLARRCPE